MTMSGRIDAAAPRRPARRRGRAPFLPPEAAEFLRKRAGEAVGAVLLALAVAAALALVSYAPSDPSLNTASGENPANLLGRPGAYAADLLLQTLGLAGALPAIILAAWGWRLAAHRGVRPMWLRLALLPLCLAAAAMTLSALPVGDGWPLRAGLGGALGALLMDDLAAATSALTTAVDAALLAWITAAATVAAFVPTAALSMKEWRAMGRAARWLTLAPWRAARWALRREWRSAPEADLTPAPRRRRRRKRVEPLLAETPVHDASAAAAAVGPAAADSALVEPPKPAARPGKRAAERQGKLDLAPADAFRLPELALLDPMARAAVLALDKKGLENIACMLEAVLADFGVRGEIVKVRPGPVVTLYELEPAPGVKTSRVIGLADDIARSMSAVSARVAVTPGHSTIGVELPNRDRELVGLRELLASDAYERSKAKLPLVLGKDIGGAPVIADLARMPHLLVAGTTGSGKSVAVNAMILSLLYRHTPDQVRMIMIDPKMLELSIYDGVPHLLSPVVTDPRKAVVALKWTVREMEERYRAMSRLGVRSIEGYNTQLAEARAAGETLTRAVQTGFDPDTGAPVFEEQDLDLTPFPYMVVVADEIADLMLVAGKDIEAAIQRLAQMARAAGIHLILATQRPSVDVITGTIKANLPTRVSFQVTSKIDSRTILGEQGAEQLLGQGDMLYMAGGGRVSRVHGPFVSDDEVERVCRALKAQGAPAYVGSVTDDETVADGIPGFAPPGGGGGGEEGDALYDEAVAVVTRERKASTSFVQRHLQVGYNRAARIIERMEREGVVSQANHVGRREVLVDAH